MSDPVSIVISNDIAAIAQKKNTSTKLNGTNFVIPVPPSTPQGSNGPKMILPNDNLTLLHIAAYSDSLECFIYLHTNQNGIPLDVRSGASYTPIYYACCGGSIEVVSYIISQWLAEGNDIDSLFMDDYTNNKEYLLPYLAVVPGSSKILKILFENGYNFEKAYRVNRSKANKAFEHAIKTSHVACLEILLRHQQPSKGVKDWSPLMLAIINSQPDAIPLLLRSKCDPAEITPDNNTAISLACFQGQPGAVRQIAEVLVDVDLPASTLDKAAVHWICQSHNVEIARILLEKNIDVNRFDRDGHLGPYYMLDMGEESETLEILNMLYEHGLDINLHKPGQNTMLGDFITCIKRPYKIIEWLIHKGADTTQPLISKGITGKTAQTIGQFMKRAALRDKSMKRIVDEWQIK